jgi:uncharacterized protein with GYD domain
MMCLGAAGICEGQRRLPDLVRKSRIERMKNMARYVVLLNLAEGGVAAVKDSVAWADAFHTAAAKAGATVEALFWTLGLYDAMFLLDAPDETTATALVLEMDKRNNLRSCMLRAFSTEEFAKIMGKVP